MLGELKSWVISICTMVVLITAVEMLIPNNSFRKYVKFVLGLILITVLINPIIKVFDRGFNIDNYVSRAVTYFDTKGYEKNVGDFKQESMSNTLSTFKLNLEQACEAKLKENFPNNTYKVEANVGFEQGKDSVYVQSLKVGIKDGSIDKVKRVEISTKGNVTGSIQTLNDEKSRLVKEFLCKELKLSNASIEVYKN